MEKQEYLNKSYEVFETLKRAIDDFDLDVIGVPEMQNIIRKAWENRPKGFILVDYDLCEIFELDESLVGQVIPDEFSDSSTEEYQNEIVDDIIASVPEWKEDDHGRCSICGSNSFIQNIIGTAEWMKFTCGRI